MKLQVPITKGRLFSLVISGTAAIGIITNLLIPETSPLTLIKYEAPSAQASIYLSGEVNIPGVYEINEGTKLVELIDQAGGFTSFADTSFIAEELNLAGLVTDQDHIHIPQTEQVLATSAPKPSSGKININSASKSELESLSGVGSSIADRLIAGRPYVNREDLLEVPGIGDAKLKQFESEIEF